MKQKHEITPNLWRTMVRDFEGRWTKYENLTSTYTKSKYFWGKEDWEHYLENKERPDVVSLVNANTACWDFWERRLDDINSIKTYFEYLEWLQKAHKLMIWKEANDSLRMGISYLSPSSGHTPVVFGDIIPLAKRFGDPYPNEAQGPVFKSIPPEGLPADVVISKGRIDHYYPHPKYFPDYLKESLKQLKKICLTKPELTDIAYFYQITMNMHLFETINNSLAMNIVNYILRKNAYLGIECGILDFVCYRLQPKNFSKYFEEEVKRIQ